MSKWKFDSLVSLCAASIFSELEASSSSMALSWFSCTILSASRSLIESFITAPSLIMF